MSLTLHANDDRLTWGGAVSLDRRDEWVMPWRIPYPDRDLYFDALKARAAMAAGVRLAFLSDTTLVAGEVVPFEGAPKLDLCCDGELVGSLDLAGKDRFCFEDLPPGEKRVELWLPNVGEFRLKRLELSDGATVAPFEDRRPKWITYGSSISHCGAAESPVWTWPAVVARGMDINLTCLGFGGNCHLDPLVATIMRDCPADFLSMCVGINIYGSGSLNPRTFRSGIIGFVRLVREKNPDAPFVVMSPIYSPPRETTENAVGFTLQAMREEAASAVAALRGHGDRNVHYVNGLDVFGEDLGELLPDDVHPNAEGYKVMGRNFLEKAARTYFA